jgi:hypothetical protein
MSEERTTKSVANELSEGTESQTESYDIVTDDPEFHCMQVCNGVLMRHLTGDPEAQRRVVNWLMQKFACHDY